MEKLKESFAKERADWNTEKSALRKRTEDAEAVLKPVVDELTGVKRQVHAMTAAVFGEHLFLNTFPCVAGLLMFAMMQELALVVWALMFRRS